MHILLFPNQNLRQIGQGGALGSINALEPLIGLALKAFN